MAAKAKVGSVEFWATSVSGPGAARRIVSYTGIGISGAVTEDLGRDARVETLTATVEETVYIDLIAVMDAAKVVTCAHPLFGVMQARVQSVQYNAGPNDLVDITVTLIEHGDPAVFNPLVFATLGSAIGDTSSAFDDLTLDIATMSAFDDLTDPLSAAADAMTSAMNTFDSVMDLASAGDAIFDDVAGGFAELAAAGQDLVDAVDTAWSDVTDLVTLDIQDNVYSMIDAARGVVDAMEQQAVDVWQEFKVNGSVGISDIAREFLGSDTDDAIQMILDKNPQILDVSALAPGVSLSIPVL